MGMSSAARGNLAVTSNNAAMDMAIITAIRFV
jgi:hypothetical protein